MQRSLTTTDYPGVGNHSRSEFHGSARSAGTWPHPGGAHSRNTPCNPGSQRSDERLVCSEARVRRVSPRRVVPTLVHRSRPPSDVSGREPRRQVLALGWTRNEVVDARGCVRPPGWRGGWLRSQRSAGARPASSALFVVPDATDIRQTSDYDGSVSYRVAEPYPARSTVDLISKTLATRGWRPEPMLPTSGRSPTPGPGWEQFDTADGWRVRQWIGEWSNHEGAVLVYHLVYRARNGAPMPDVVQVSGALLARDTAAAPPRVAWARLGHDATGRPMTVGSPASGSVVSGGRSSRSSGNHTIDSYFVKELTGWVITPARRKRQNVPSIMWVSVMLHVR